MNAERLLNVAEYLVDRDTRLGLQTKLEELRGTLDNLTSNPGNPDFQQQASKALDNLETAYRKLEKEATPGRIQTIRDINALPFFSRSLPDGIRALLTQNSVTPASVRDRAVQLVSERAELLRRLKETVVSLKSFGIESEWPMPGTGDIGFLLPRSLFENTLGGFSKELSELNRIVSTYSELATGQPENIELHELSTSDPLVFVGVSVGTLALIGKGISWALDTWKKLLEIRGLHEHAKSAGMPAVVLDHMKQHLNDTIKAKIDEHVAQIVPADLADQGRKHELENQLRWALKQVLAKIERGMTVEIRLLPPPTPLEEVEGEGKQDGPDAFTRLAELAKSLDFPAIQGEPLTALEAPPAEQAVAA